MRTTAAALLALVMLSGIASAQHRHGGKGPNGGAMEDVAGVHAELIAEGNALTFNVLDEDSKPINTAGYSGSVLVISGADREMIQLAPSGASSLKGETKRPVAAGAAITLMLKTDGGKTGQAKYKR